MYVEVKTKVVPATADQLMRFSLRDLQDYAISIGMSDARQFKKRKLVRELIEKYSPTLCASLGN